MPPAFLARIITTNALRLTNATGRTLIYAMVLAFYIVLTAALVTISNGFDQSLRVLADDVSCLGEGPSSEYVAAARSMQSNALNRLNRRIDRLPTLLIDTYFHIIVADEERNSNIVSDQMIHNQFMELSQQYRAVGISFRLIHITRTVNTVWATNGDDIAMKAALRHGTYTSLNLYFQTQLASDPASPNTTQFLGFSKLPDFSGRNGSYTHDGCNIHAGSMPGGHVLGNNLGKTAVHEVGHWFGLLHTFHGDSCEGDGDFVDDTRQERHRTEGCPVGKNTCPELEGVDPITNFMDYSSDACYEGFTVGQQERMFDMFAEFRTGL